MFIKCETDGAEHVHTTLADAVTCMSVPFAEISIKVTTRSAVVSGSVAPTPDVPTPATPSPAYGPARPVSGTPVEVIPERPRRSSDPSGPQLGLISRLGGSWRDAYLGTRKEASYTISLLQDENMRLAFKMPEAPAGVTSLNEEEWEAFPQELAYMKGELGPEWGSFDYNTGELNGVPTKRASDDDDQPFPYGDDEEYAPSTSLKVKSRIETMAPLLDKIPSGYFATTSIDQPDSDHLTFMRVARPKTGRYRGAMKVQTLHGERLEVAWVRWPSGTISIYNYTIEDCILMLIADHVNAARLFAQKRKRCARCGTGLTDPRSRKLGIGPECEKHWPAYIDAVLLDLATRGESL